MFESILEYPGLSTEHEHDSCEDAYTKPNTHCFLMAIFDGVQYAIASAISNNEQRDISNLLNANGAVEVLIQQATHIITPTLEFEGARNVSDSCVLVTPTWIERSQVLGKIQE
jgi:hypothetical protein